MSEEAEVASQSVTGQQPTVIVHEIRTKGLSRLIIPPLILAGAVYSVIRTEGKHEHINFLVPLFSMICAWSIL